MEPFAHPTALRCYEQPGHLTLSQALAELQAELTACPLVTPLLPVEPGQLYRHRDGAYWRINAHHPPTGFCWVEAYDWRGLPLGRYGVVYSHQLLSPGWFLVDLQPRASRSLGQRIRRWCCRAMSTLWIKLNN